MGKKVVIPEGKKITDQKVVVQDIEPSVVKAKISRPEELFGKTVRVKHKGEDAIYLTINDHVMDGVRTPFELFVSSKSMESFEWITAMLRISSLHLQSENPPLGIAEGLMGIKGPSTRYRKKGYEYLSEVDEIGHIFMRHLRDLGLGPKVEVSDEVRSELNDVSEKLVNAKGGNADGYPVNSVLCKTCYATAVINEGGCSRCLSCGASVCT